MTLALTLTLALALAVTWSLTGVPLQDGLREVNRHLRAHRLLAAGQTLRPVEKMITQACLAPRDGQERNPRSHRMYTMTKRACGGRRVLECVHDGTCTHTVGRFDAVSMSAAPPSPPAHPSSQRNPEPARSD